MYIHIHTKYSLLDSIIEPEQLVKKIKEQSGDKATLCVTEHGNVYSSVEIYKLCKKYGVKYLYGCEMYICNDVTIKSKDNKYSHLVVIAKNETGRLNLNKLISESCHYKYYGKPRIDFDMLVRHKEGLIVLSACMAGQIQRALMSGDIIEAQTITEKYKKEFGDDYYLEYQSHSEKTQQQLNRQIVDLANKLNIKYVVTTDAHYLNKEDQKYHNIFVQIGQSREVGETYNDCYVQSKDEILKICKSTTKEENLTAIKNLNEIADKCNVEIPLSAPIMPHVEIPKKFKSEIDYLKHLCVKGWHDKKINTKPNKEDYKKRLLYEMTSIEKMGFEGYFLLVHSYCNSVKRRGIARGSSGGSLVCYLSNITDIDPLEYGLYFERFIDVGALDLLEQGKISKEELKIPDVDSDFGKADREKVLEHVIKQYGEERVVSLGSFQYIWAKGAIKDIGRVLGIPFEVTNKMTAQLDKETIQEVIELGLLDNYKNQYPDLFEYAERLAGLPKSFSAHPCGKVIAMDDVIYYNATDINDEGLIILQGDMHVADDLGLIKADFLGLRTIDVIYDTLELIGKDYEYIAPHNIDFNDEKVWCNFRNGFTSGIFQFESNGMKDTLKKIDCSNIDDLTTANALFRPGSLKFIDNYANRKKGIEDITYIHDDLKPILKNSYGIIVYQEQLIEIGRLAKLSNPDKLRKATGKKNPQLLAEIQPELYKGLSNRGWTQEQLDNLWETMLDFAKYSFNKSHAAGYAIIAYICMYLKTHHPKEFICSWINSVSNKTEKVAECVSEAKRMAIPIYLGKYNNCFDIAKVYNNGIMMGTKTIKFCNSQIADEILNLSQEKKYTSFIDLLDDINSKTSINTRQLQILIGLNFFSDFGENKYLLKIIELYDGIKQNNKIMFPSLRTCKQIKKDKLDSYSEYGLSEYLVQKYADKETPKQYSGIDNMGLLNEMITKIPNKPMGIIEQIKFDMEYLQYTDYKNDKMNENYWIVIDFKTYRDECKPSLVLHNIKTGEEIKTRIKQAKLFRQNPFGCFSILKIEGFTYDYKKKLVNNEWVNSDETEAVLTEWEIIK
jgi:DNA polymerase-3 subunit alpha